MQVENTCSCKRWCYRTCFVSISACLFMTMCCVYCTLVILHTRSDCINGRVIRDTQENTGHISVQDMQKQVSLFHFRFQVRQTLRIMTCFSSSLKIACCKKRTTQKRDVYTLEIANVSG